MGSSQVLGYKKPAVKLSAFLCNLDKREEVASFYSTATCSSEWNICGNVGAKGNNRILDRTVLKQNCVYVCVPYLIQRECFPSSELWYDMNTRKCLLKH